MSRIRKFIIRFDVYTLDGDYEMNRVFECEGEGEANVEAREMQKHLFSSSVMGFELKSVEPFTAPSQQSEKVKCNSKTKKHRVSSHKE